MHERMLTLLLALPMAAQSPNIARPWDYAVLSPALGELGPVHHYVVEKPPTIFTADGKIETCPSVIPLLYSTAEDPYGYEWVDTRQGGAVTNRLGVSRRCVMVTRWITNYRGTEIEWMSQGTAIGGNGLGMNERRFARYGTATQEHHNPTFGSGARLPYMQGPYHSSWPLHLLISSTKIEGGVAPHEWDPDGTTGGSDHGGDPGRPVLAWRERQFGRVDMHFQNRPSVHRCIWWGYMAEPWMPTADMAPVLAYLAPALHCRGRMFDKAYFADLSSGSVTEVPYWTPPSATSPHYMRAEATVSGMVVDDPAGNRTNQASPFPSGYAACIYRRTSDDFCVGIAMRIYNTSDFLRRPTGINAIQSLGSWPEHPVPVQYDETAVMEPVSKSTEGRVQGWCGLNYFLFVGAWQDAVPTMVALRQGGYLDLQPPKNLPVLGGVKPP